ncbi:MAG: zinc ribbon domain-containing protein [Anaerolineales bacterium]|nr:zinc ribbon domain-containing protein [Anaerolineales bacterium]
MPTYTYQCDDCGTVFNKHLSFNDDPNHVTCPQNGSKHVHRVYSAPPVVFKGSGFYVTDHSAAKSTYANGINANGTNGTNDSNGKNAEAKPKTEPTTTQTAVATGG